MHKHFFPFSWVIEISLTLWYFSVGVLYRLSLITAVRLRIHFQYYPHRMILINEVPKCMGTKKMIYYCYCKNIQCHHFPSEMSAKIFPSSSVGHGCSIFIVIFIVIFGHHFLCHLVKLSIISFFFVIFFILENKHKICVHTYSIICLF